MPAPSPILIVATSADEFRKAGYRTGLWLSELTRFYDVAEEAGHSMDVASPAGGKIPIDPASLAESVLDAEVADRYRNRAFMDRLAQSAKLADVDPGGYGAIYLAGGHGAMFDFPDSPDLQRLVAAFWDAGKVVSAVCHGPAGLLNVRVGDGSLLLADKKVTGFSWNEEIQFNRDDVVPYNLEDELRDRGATYGKAWFAMGIHVVEDGRLVTGQNPPSVQGVAQAVVRLLQEG